MVLCVRSFEGNQVDGFRTLWIHNTIKFHNQGKGIRRNAPTEGHSPSVQNRDNYSTMNETGCFIFVFTPHEEDSSRS